MTAVLYELFTYLFKFFAMILCAACGIIVGKKIRANKDQKAQESNE